MNKQARTNSACERAEQLVAYLYGETNATETPAFEQHLKTCAVCRDELVAFGHLRSEINVWHDAVLQSAPSLPAISFETALITPQTSQNGLFGVTANKLNERKRSASAAFREFFTLSPLWLKAGSFATALALLCVLSVLALANTEVRWDNSGIAFSTGTRKDQPNETKNTGLARSNSTDFEVVALREQVKNLTTERAALQAERDGLRGKLEQTTTQLAAQTTAVQNLNASLQRAGQQIKPRVIYVNAPTTNRNLRGIQRLQEAENNDERDAPRLIDLIGDGKD